VRLDDVAAGWLRPGDRIDLLSRTDGSAPRAGEDEDDGEDGVFLARRALVLPPPAADTDDSKGGLLDVGGGTGGGSGVTLVAVAPADAPRLSAASGWGTVGAVLVP
jgi:pilus assembly protein CpaB